jgi:hypothetical protein
MRRRLLAATLLLAGSAFTLPGRVAAQHPSPAEASAKLRLAASAPVIRTPAIPARSLLVLPDSVVARRKDHTVTGLLVGAGLGFAAGWAFYDTICEAVDNRCSDSRVRLLLMGTATGASLGALIGSLAD